MKRALLRWGALGALLAGVLALPTGVPAASNYPAPNFTQVGAGLLQFGTAIAPFKCDLDSDNTTCHLVVDIASGGGGGGTFTFPFNAGYNQTPTSASFVGVGGYDGTHFQPQYVDSSGNAHVLVENTPVPTYTPAASPSPVAGPVTLVEPYNSAGLPVTFPSFPPLTITGPIGSIVTDPVTGNQASVTQVGTSSTYAQVVSGGVTTTPVSSSGSGTLTSSSTSATAGVIIPVQGYGGLTGQISNYSAGVIRVYGSTDGGVTYPTQIIVNVGGVATSGITSNTNFTAALPAFTNVSVYFSSGASGTPVVTWNLGAAPIYSTSTSFSSGNTPNIVATSTDALNPLQSLLVTNLGMAFNGNYWDRTYKDSYAAAPVWSDGGGGSTLASPVAVGSSGSVIKASAGRLARIVITTVATGSGVGICYNSPSAASGTILAEFGASSPLGPLNPLDMPAPAGIYCTSTSSTGPAFTVSYY